jgi:hypothetical protein
VAERDRHRPWLITHTPQTYHGCDFPQPDGLGVWAEAGRETVFVLEYDTGSEHLPKLTAKLPGYARLAETMARLGHTFPRCCSVSPASAARHPPAGRSPPATTPPRCGSPPPPSTRSSPAQPGRYGSLKRPPGSGGPVGLSALDTALPDPWAQHPLITSGRGRRQHRPSSHAAPTTPRHARQHSQQGPRTLGVTPAARARGPSRSRDASSPVAGTRGPVWGRCHGQTASPYRQARACGRR